MRKKNYTRIFETAAAGILLCIIWGHSMMSPSASTAESDWVAGFVDFGLPWGQLTYLIRKTAHFSEFAAWVAVAFLNLRHVSGYRPQTWVNALFAGLLVAVTDEFIQLFSGRGSLVADVVLDFGGCLFGSALCLACLHVWRTHRSKLKKREVDSDE